ncbi:MAG TPA: GNAT family N-acetyltransferase [Candidatus Binatia bacterium]|nr:GNAT family N-acetyltransferase [Candidatus Binatia bacterium]
MSETALRFPPDYREVCTLEDGTEIRLRLLRSEDRDALVAGFQELSAESRYRRFFSAMPRLPENVLHDLLDTDGWNHLAIVAFTAGDGHGVAIGRFIRIDKEPEVAEAAVAVVDAMQGRGLGKLLLTLLASAAYERGIRKFRAQVLTDNDAMVALLHELDRKAQPAIDGPVATYELDLPEPADEGFMTGPLFDMLRAAGRGLEVMLERLQHFPRY